MFQSYISRPVEVEAVYWDGSDSVLEALALKGAQFQWANEHSGSESVSVVLRLLTGVRGEQDYVPVPKGTYIIYSETPVAHFYPCDKETFEHKYDQLIPGAITIDDVTKRSYTGTFNPDGTPSVKGW